MKLLIMHENLTGAFDGMSINVSIDAYCDCNKKKECNGVKMHRIGERTILITNELLCLFRCPKCGSLNSVRLKLFYNDYGKGLKFL